MQRKYTLDLNTIHYRNVRHGGPLGYLLVVTHKEVLFNVSKPLSLKVRNLLKVDGMNSTPSYKRILCSWRDPRQIMSFK